METPNLDVRLLDTAINTMARNRTLLFTINIIAAILIAVCYLENFSIDERQRKAYLTAYQDRCETVKKAVDTAVKENTIDPITDTLNSKQRRAYASCSDIDLIQNLIVEKVPDVKLNYDENHNPVSEDGILLSLDEYQKRKNLKERRGIFINTISEQLFRLRRIRSDIGNSRLENAQVAPLGFGLSIPRNDLVIVCGGLLVMLYLWLMFSYNQHVRILSKIKLLFPEEKSEKNYGVKATINDLVELNFLFRTSDRKSYARHLVRILYWLAPISMLLMTVNDFYSGFTENSQLALNPFINNSSLAKFLITFLLVLIGLRIYKLDKDSNKELKNLIYLYGIRIGMTRRNVFKLFNASRNRESNSVTIEKDDIENSKANQRYDLRNVQRIELVFSKAENEKYFRRFLMKRIKRKADDYDRLKSIEVTHSEQIFWSSSAEFAEKLSDDFNLPFQFWELDSKTSSGIAQFENFSIKIDTKYNQVTIEETASQKSADKIDFKPRPLTWFKKLKLYFLTFI